ncbi:MAG: cutinase, partial [Mycolicibacterium aromaticivorans]|nr:cutinase [Mycolicibacterium aromaticivorans]
TSQLPPAIGTRTISVCDVGDPVCDYNPDTGKISDAAIAIHTSYAPAVSGPNAWVTPLYTLVTATETAAPMELSAHTA